MSIRKIKTVEVLDEKELKTIQGGWWGIVIREAIKILGVVGAVASAGNAIESFVRGWNDCECE